MKNLTEAARRLEEHRLAYVHPMTAWLRSIRGSEVGKVTWFSSDWSSRTRRGEGQRTRSH
jgi:hypothetical protein